MVRAAIYIDTSGSMFKKIDGTPRINLARNMWNDIKNRFDGQYSKISTINGVGNSTVLGQLRKRNLEALDRIEIPKPSGGTYLWGFLIEEAEKLIKSHDDWIFVLISDGGDTDSEGELKGEGGLEPCARKIKEIGLDVEFIIIGLDLKESVAESFRKLCGESGGFFENIENSNAVETVVEKLDNTLSEMGDLAARERRRNLRYQHYLDTTPDTDRPALDLFNAPVVRKLSYGGRVETLTTVSPVETIDWLEDLLKIRGHVNTLRADSGEFWFEVESEIPDHELLENGIHREDCWAIDSDKLVQSLTPSQSQPKKEKIVQKIRNIFSRKPVKEEPKQKSVHDILWELNADIRKASKDARKKIIFRGDEFPQDYFTILKNGLGDDMEVLIYPKILPPPPPPAFDVSIEEYDSWLNQINPSRDEWFQFPEVDFQGENFSTLIKKAVIVDSLIHPDYCQRMLESIDLNLEFRKLKIALKKSPFMHSEPIDVEFLSPNYSRKEFVEWSEKYLLNESENNLVEQFINYVQIVSIKVMRHYLKLEGMKPNLLVFRFCEMSNNLNLTTHPFYTKVLQVFKDLRSRVVFTNNTNKLEKSDIHWGELQIDTF